MSEKFNDPVQIEIGRKEASLLGKNPYVKATLEQSQFVLQRAFGFTPAQLDLVNNVGFMYYGDRLALFMGEVTASDLFLDETSARGVRVRDEDMPGLPNYMVRKSSSPNTPADIYVSTYMVGDLLKSSSAKIPDNVAISRGAVHLLNTLCGAVLEEITPVVALGADEEVLKELALKAVDGFSTKVVDPSDPRVEKLIKDILARINGGESLALEAKGASARLMLGRQVLDRYYEDEDAMIGYALCETPEDNFIRRMADSKVNGKKWFVKPEGWKGIPFRLYQDDDRYLSMRAMVQNEGVRSLLPRYLNGEIASEFLLRDGILRIPDTALVAALTEAKAVDWLPQHQIELAAKAGVKGVDENTQELLDRFGHLIEQDEYTNEISEQEDHFLEPDDEEFLSDFDEKEDRQPRRSNNRGQNR